MGPQDGKLWLAMLIVQLGHVKADVGSSTSRFDSKNDEYKELVDKGGGGGQLVYGSTAGTSVESKAQEWPQSAIPLSLGGPTLCLQSLHHA